MVVVVEGIVAALVEVVDGGEGGGNPTVEEDEPKFEVFPGEVVLVDGGVVVGWVVVVVGARPVVEGVDGVVVGTTTGASVTGGVGGGRTRM